MTRPDDFAAILASDDPETIDNVRAGLAPLLLDLWRACVEFDDQWLMEDSTERRIKDALAALEAAS